jgi:plasmid stabilization system protein ParE
MGGDVPRELRYTDKALADLDAITSWLTHPGAGPTARRRLTAVWVAIERLREHPCLYPVASTRLASIGTCESCPATAATGRCIA